jgi:hypothetical protein
MNTLIWALLFSVVMGGLLAYFGRARSVRDEAPFLGFSGGPFVKGPPPKKPIRANHILPIQQEIHYGNETIIVPGKVIKKRPRSAKAKTRT